MTTKTNNSEKQEKAFEVVTLSGYKSTSRNTKSTIETPEQYVKSVQS